MTDHAPVLKPLSFSDAMVLGFMGGRKTQTRRLLGLDDMPVLGPQWDKALVQVRGDLGPRLRVPCLTDCAGTSNHTAQHLYPRWTAGDRFYVREALERYTDDGVAYRADGELVLEDGEGPCFETWRWKRDVLPAMFMPRKLARAFGEIVYVRIERLQDINVGDCWAEGCPYHLRQRPEEHVWFELLWDTLHTKAGTRWADDPWVEALTLKRISREEAYSCPDSTPGPRAATV